MGRRHGGNRKGRSGQQVKYRQTSVVEPKEIWNCKNCRKTINEAITKIGTHRETCQKEKV